MTRFPPKWTKSPMVTWLRCVFGIHKLIPNSSFWSISVHRFLAPRVMCRGHGKRCTTSCTEPFSLLVLWVVCISRVNQNVGQYTTHPERPNHIDVEVFQQHFLVGRHRLFPSSHRILFDLRLRNRLLRLELHAKPYTLNHFSVFEHLSQRPSFSTSAYSSCCMFNY